MKHTVSYPSNGPKRVKANLMTVGEIGRVERGHGAGKHLLRTFGDKWIVLEEPVETYSLDPARNIDVEILPPGTELRLVVGAGDS